MSINRNLVINYLLVFAAVTISFPLLTSCSKSETKRENAPVSYDISAPTVPAHESTTALEQSVTEDETTIEVTTSAEPSTQPTAEAATAKPAEATTQKTTAKTQKTKSTTTERSETVKTTAEDVPQPEPEVIAERPEKLSPELRDWVAGAQPEEIIEVYIWRDGLPDDYIDALVQSEYGFEPEVQEELEYINDLIEARRTIIKREYTKLNDEFIANYIPKERKVIYAGEYTSTITVEATAKEILFYSSLPQVAEISADFGLGEPISSDEEEIIEASDPTTSD